MVPDAPQAQTRREDATLPLTRWRACSPAFCSGPTESGSLLDPAPVSQQGLVPGPHHATGGHTPASGALRLSGLIDKTQVVVSANCLANF